MKERQFALIGMILTVAGAYGQGQVTFSNFSTADGLSCRVILWGGNGATSPPYYAQLLRVQSAVETPVGTPVSFRPQPAAAGYLVPTIFTIDGAAIGEVASFRMVVLQGNFYSENAVIARSSVSTVSLGGRTIVPPALLGLTDISGNPNIMIPEPSSMAIVILAGCALLPLARRPLLVKV